MTRRSFPDIEQRTGLFPGIDYRDLPPGLSYSGAKDILQSPFLYQWKRQQPRTATDAMDKGTVVHALTLGTPQTWRTVAGGRGVTDRKEAVRAQGLVPIALDDLADAAAMTASLLDVPEFADLLGHCPPERREIAAVAREDDEAPLLRVIFDALHHSERYGLDVKTGRAGTLADFGRTAYNLGYHIQAAASMAVMEWLGTPLDAFLFCVVESEPPFLAGVRELDAESVAVGRSRLREAMDLYAACVAADDWPKPPTYQRVSLPGWALRKDIA